MIFIKNDNTDPFYNHALEEYILGNFTEEVFILWRNRPSILIGRNQNVQAQINMEFVEAHHIDVVRRLSGGGTVFCDLGNINFTFITNKDGNHAGFEAFASPVIKALQSLGVPANFTGRNDITIEGKKISGNAQYHYKNRLLHHGTILFNGDLSQLKGALLSNPLKFKDKSVQSVASRVTNIHNYLQNDMDVLTFKNYLQNYITDMYKIQQIYELTEEDQDAIQKIKVNRFENWDWNYGKSPTYSFSNEVKYPSGLIEIQLNVQKGIILSLSVFGDFFGKENIQDLYPTIIGTKHTKEDILNCLKDVSIQNYIEGITLDEFIATMLPDIANDNQPSQSEKYIRKPEWLRVKVQSGKKLNQVNQLIKDLKLNTVCLEANCPNKMECYNRKTATFMILGRNCTRNCTFCNVTKKTPDPLDPKEPENVALAVKELGLKHAVITSVTRDDLDDQGANQFAKVVEAIRNLTPKVAVELLIPDMNGKEALLDIILQTNPHVLNHNIETVPSLYSKIRPMASYERSLNVIKYSKNHYPNILTKSGMMLGLGETKEEVIQVMKDLLQHGCEILTLGQYLQPSSEHVSLVEYITPNQFEEYKEIALDLGFKSVASAPLVRSSYHADELV